MLLSGSANPKRTSNYRIVSRIHRNYPHFFCSRNFLNTSKYDNDGCWTTTTHHSVAENWRQCCHEQTTRSTWFHQRKTYGETHCGESEYPPTIQVYQDGWRRCLWPCLQLPPPLILKCGRMGRRRNRRKSQRRWQLWSWKASYDWFQPPRKILWQFVELRLWRASFRARTLLATPAIYRSQSSW